MFIVLTNNATSVRNIMRSSGIPPSIGILPHKSRLFYRNAFLLKKLANLPSFKAIRALIRRLKNKMMMISSFYFLTFLLLLVSHFTQVMWCFDKWYFWNRFVIDAIFVCMVRKMSAYLRGGIFPQVHASLNCYNIFVTQGIHIKVYFFL